MPQEEKIASRRRRALTTLAGASALLAATPARLWAAAVGGTSELGLAEIPRLVVFNKIDAADPLHLRALGRQVPDAEFVSATRREGIERLVDAIDRHRAAQTAAGALAERRVRGQVEWGLREHLRRVGDEGLDREGGIDAARARIEARVRRGTGPF